MRRAVANAALPARVPASSACAEHMFISGPPDNNVIFWSLTNQCLIILQTMRWQDIKSMCNTQVPGSYLAQEASGALLFFHLGGTEEYQALGQVYQVYTYMTTGKTFLDGSESRSMQALIRGQ
jgi:hypothetical protein